MISKDILKKIRHIEIKSDHLSGEILSGEYRSGFKGKGMIFEDIRMYYPGDDIRHIDWNSSARHGHTYVKQFSEERERSIYLILDISASNEFGAKREYMAEIAATLAMAANKNNDRIGLILFSDTIEVHVPSASGRRHVLSIIDKILTTKASSKGTHIEGALEHFFKIEKKPQVAFLLSDFMDTGYEKAVNRVRGKHDLALIRVLDRGEGSLPPGAIYTFHDMESDQVMTIDATKEGYDLQLPESIGRLALDLRTGEDYVKPLKAYFRRKGRR